MNEGTVETRRVLAVTREITLLHPLLSLAESNCWQLETAVSGWEAMERVQSDVAPHLLLLDLPRADGDSLHTLRWLRRLRPDMPVVVTCHREDSQRQKEAIRLGAEIVLIRPFTENHLESVIRQYLESPIRSEEVDFASDDVESLGENEFFLGLSPAMQKVRAQADLLAQADVPVLIVGEPGSGKATVARLIHKLSLQSGFSFQRVDCASMPGELLEIELFGRNGHPHGENGSRRNGFGKFEHGGKGTLLLEEITEMPLAVQSRVFQVLQNRQFFRAGDETPVGVDVRILATTSAKLDRALSEKRLREDLYYRLSAFTVHVPPLRQRREEIKVLLHYSMHKLAHYYGLPQREFTPSVLDACVNHSWPGNLEELEIFVKRYLAAGDKEINLGTAESRLGNHDGGASSDFHHLSSDVNSEFDDSGDTSPKSLKSLIKTVKSEAEKNAIAVALEKTSWNRKAAARLLKVSYRTLLYKIEQYHMSESASYVTSLAANRSAGPKAS
jgi:two-component system, NtrC family, response regulator AtoC